MKHLGALIFIVMMMVFAETQEADALDEFNGHYFQLLISELLYKNYYEQSNRPMPLYEQRWLL